MFRRVPLRPVRTIGRRQHHCARRSNERLHRRIFEIGFVHLRGARVGGRRNGAAQAVPLPRAIHAPTACSPRLPKAMSSSGVELVELDTFLTFPLRLLWNKFY